MTALCEASYTDDASQWMEIGASDRYWAAQNRNWSDVGKTRLEDTLVRTPRLLFIVRPWNTEDGLMCSCLSVYPHNFSQNWADGGVQVDAAPLGPSFHYCFVLLGVYVLQGFHHQWKIWRWETYAASSRSLWQGLLGGYPPWEIFLLCFLLLGASTQTIDFCILPPYQQGMRLSLPSWLEGVVWSSWNMLVYKIKIW